MRTQVQGILKEFRHLCDVHARKFLEDEHTCVRDHSYASPLEERRFVHALKRYEHIL